MREPKSRTGGTGRGASGHENNSKIDPPASTPVIVANAEAGPDMLFGWFTRGTDVAI
jgi:hypothetical protein